MTGRHDIAVNGTTLCCQVDGREGAPWLVFSNSLMTDLELWSTQVDAFGDRHRILRYDTRGHGGSRLPEEDCRFDQLIDDAKGLLDHFGIARAAVVGVSMGGVTALGLAGKYPDRITHAAICDCQPVATPAGSAAWEARIATATHGGMVALVEPTIARWFRPQTVQANPSALDDIRRMIAQMSLEGFIRATRALQDYDVRPYLSAIVCPTGFIVGADDAALPAAMQQMAQGVATAGLTALPNCGHLPNIERTDAFNAALAVLLARAPYGS